MFSVAPFWSLRVNRVCPRTRRFIRKHTLTIKDSHRKEALTACILTHRIFKLRAHIREEVIHSPVIRAEDAHRMITLGTQQQDRYLLLTGAPIIPILREDLGGRFLENDILEIRIGFNAAGDENNIHNF